MYVFLFNLRAKIAGVNSSNGQILFPFFKNSNDYENETLRRILLSVHYMKIQEDQGTPRRPTVTLASES